MEIGTTTAIAIYFIIWWVVLFAVLPWGIRSQEESGDVVPGTDPGAPAVHLVWRKLLWTTITAAVVFGILTAIYKGNLIPIDLLQRIANPPHT
jgi:predicted secreted protein